MDRVRRCSTLLAGGVAILDAARAKAAKPHGSEDESGTAELAMRSSLLACCDCAHVIGKCNEQPLSRSLHWDICCNIVWKENETLCKSVTAGNAVKTD